MHLFTLPVSFMWHVSHIRFHYLQLLTWSFFLFLPYCISPFIVLLCFCRFWVLCHHHRGQEAHRSFKQCGLCCDHSGYLSLFLSVYIKREKLSNSTNFIGCGEVHGSEKTSLFNASMLKVADFACACLLNSMPAIFMMYSHFSVPQRLQKYLYLD